MPSTSAPTGRLHVRQRTVPLVRRLAIRDGYFRDETGTPVYLIGANFWPKRTGPWMYRDVWDLGAVAADLGELAALGANVVRVFCFVPDFMPDPNTVSQQAIDRLCATIDAAAAARMWSIPTLFVGHMSGENWHPDWAVGKDWYTNDLVLTASELLVRTVGTRLGGNPNVAAWLLTNEWPLFAGRTTDELGLRWARRLCTVLREVDPGVAVSLGDGAWDVIGGERSGLPTRELVPIIDFFGPHFYPKETDALRHSAVASFAMRMLQPLGRPVFLEEFGCSSDQVDERYAAGYYRTTLWSAFGADNCGTLVWNSHDFAIGDRPPYAHHPYELHFGIVRVDGSRKPQADEFARFAAFTHKHGLQEWIAERSRVTIGRSSYYLTEYPFDWGWSRPQQSSLLLQSYASLLRVGATANFIDLNVLQRADADVLFVPCLQASTTTDAQRMEAFVRSGGTVYLSYGGEPWYPQLGSLIGARPLIAYGLVAATPDTVVFNFAERWGGIAQGTKLSWAARGELRRVARLLCEPGPASVIALDQDGSPAVLEHRLGAGRVVFVTYPLEYYALSGVDANATDDTWRLYQAVVQTESTHSKTSEGAPCRAMAGAPVQFFLWRAANNAQCRRLLMVNHSWGSERVHVQIQAQLTDVESGERITHTELELESKGIRVVDIMPGTLS